MPNGYDNPSENVRKTGEDLDDTKKELITTTDTFVKEGNTDMVDKKIKAKPNVVKKAITPPISKKIKLRQLKKR